MWETSSKKCVQRSLSKIEDIHGTLDIASFPSVEGDYPESDPTPLLDEQDHRELQSLIEILNCVLVIGRTDVLFAASSLARLSTNPREGHLA